MTLSKTLIITAALAAAGSLHADTTDQTGGHIGLGAGAGAGALIGGPPGAIIGAGLGAWIGDRAARAADAENLQETLATTTADAAALDARLATTETALAERDATIAELQRRESLARTLELEILFRTDSDELDAAFARRIELLADYLRAHPGTGVRLDGFADARGSASHNERLSAARTAAVKEALLAAGVAPDRIAGFHHGAAAARAAADEHDALALDRRVLIRLEETRAAPRVARRSSH